MRDSKSNRKYERFDRDWLIFTSSTFVDENNNKAPLTEKMSGDKPVLTMSLQIR